MTTRPAEERDLAAVEEILTQALPHLVGTRRAACAPLEESAREGRRVHVAVEDGEVVAVAVTSPRMTKETGREWRWTALDALATRETHRGRGHAAELLGAVVTAAAADGTTRIHGCCPPGRASWYRERGFDVQDVDQPIHVTRNDDGKRYRLEPGRGEQLFTATTRTLQAARPTKQ